MDISSPEFLQNLQIPIDLFVSKKRKGPKKGLKFTDPNGDLVFRIEKRNLPTESTRAYVLVDSSRNSLVFLHRNINGCWEVYKGESSKEENLIFRVKRSVCTVSRAEFEIFLVGGNEEESTDFKMKGSPFHRACTIYKGDSIVAQTSLMYKLGIQKVLVTRHRFRVTIFPGFGDHAMLVALIVIFFNGRKLWI